MAKNLKRIPRKFLCIGHPRCGTAFTANLLTAFGWQVGHEEIKNDGVSSWMLAVNSMHYPWGNIGYDNPLDQYDFEMLIHVVRNPIFAIPSIILENKYSPENRSFQFRRRWIHKELGIDLPNIVGADRDGMVLSDEVELALKTFLFWNRICELRKPNIVFRIEYDFCKLDSFNKTSVQLDTTKCLRRNDSKPYQGTIYEKPFLLLTSNHLKKTNANLQNELKRFCEKYGYDGL